MEVINSFSIHTDFLNINQDSWRENSVPPISNDVRFRQFGVQINRRTDRFQVEYLVSLALV